MTPEEARAKAKALMQSLFSAHYEPSEQDIKTLSTALASAHDRGVTEGANAERTLNWMRTDSQIKEPELFELIHDIIGFDYTDIQRGQAQMAIQQALASARARGREEMRQEAADAVNGKAYGDAVAAVMALPPEAGR